MTKSGPLRASLLACAALLSACASRPPPPIAASGVTFAIERDLAGARVARGEFRSITGARRAFTAYLNGEWDGRTLTLVEDFVFDDGERDRKTWRLERTGPGRYAGTREDVVGTAMGFQDGAVFRLEYDVVLPSEGGRGLRVRFRDVLAFGKDGDILNNANVSWFGLRVARVELVISGAPSAESGGAP